MFQWDDGNGEALTRASAFDVMALLSNRIRVEILATLAGTAKCVSEIADELEIDASTVSHSLQLLAKMGLVEHKVVNKRHFYRLTGAVTALLDGSVVRLAVSTDSDGRVLVETRIR